MVLWKTIPLCGWDCLPPARQARSQFPGPAIGYRLIALVAIISDDSASGREWISLLRSEIGDYDHFFFGVWKKEYQWWFFRGGAILQQQTCLKISSIMSKFTDKDVVTAQSVRVIDNFL
jgi:hypothetical protein